MSTEPSINELQRTVLRHVLENPKHHAKKVVSSMAIHGHTPAQVRSALRYLLAHDVITSRPDLGIAYAMLDPTDVPELVRDDHRFFIEQSDDVTPEAVEIIRARAAEANGARNWTKIDIFPRHSGPPPGYSPKRDLRREAVYQAIDTERDYQDHHSNDPARPDMVRDLQLGSMIAAMEHQLEQARAAWYSGSHPHEKSMDAIRKLVGLAVQAGERFGMPRREVK